MMHPLNVLGLLVILGGTNLAIFALGMEVRALRNVIQKYLEDK